MVTMRCVTCDSRFRVYTLVPYTSNGIYKYCPNCGSERVGIMQDTEADYWETLAESYQVTPDAIKLFYNLWIQDKSSKTFGDFVNITKKELAGMTDV